MLNRFDKRNKNFKINRFRIRGTSCKKKTFMVTLVIENLTNVVTFLLKLVKSIFEQICRDSSVVEQRIENPCVTSSILVLGKNLNFWEP